MFKTYLGIVMDIDNASWILAGILGLSVAFLLFTKFYVNLRPRFGINVTCWFCQAVSRVPFNDRNTWDCKSCEQYNGFLADGGYNKIIPAQHDTSLNRPARLRSASGRPGGNGLCESCNDNQRLKVLQLASFRPRDPTRFDEEVEQFERDLERTYHLCGRCEVEVRGKLEREKAWLLGLKLSAMSYIKNKDLGSSYRRHLPALPLLLSLLLLPPLPLHMTAQTRVAVATLGAALQAASTATSRSRMGGVCVAMWLACAAAQVYATTLVQTCVFSTLLASCIAATFTQYYTRTKQDAKKSTTPRSKPPESANIFQEALQSEKTIPKLTKPAQPFEKTSFFPAHLQTKPFDEPSLFAKNTSPSPIFNSNPFRTSFNANSSQASPFSPIDLREKATPGFRTYERPRRPANDITHLLNDTSRNVTLPLSEEFDRDSMTHSTPESNCSSEAEDIDRGIGNLNINCSLDTGREVRRRRPLVAPARLPTPPCVSSLFLPVSRSSSQSSGFASQCSRTPAGSVCGEEAATTYFRSDENPFYKSGPDKSGSISPTSYIRRPHDFNVSRASYQPDKFNSSSLFESSFHTAHNSTLKPSDSASISNSSRILRSNSSLLRNNSSLLPTNSSLLPHNSSVFFPTNSFKASIIGDQIILSRSDDSVYSMGFNYAPPMFPVYCPTPPEQKRGVLIPALFCVGVLVHVCLFAFNAGWDVSSMLRKMIEWI